MLKYTFINGDPINGIKEPNTAFISVSTAKKYFGDQNPMGQILSIDKKQAAGLFMVPLLLVILITGLTISVHVIKSALNNPIDSIRDD